MVKILFVRKVDFDVDHEFLGLATILTSHPKLSGFDELGTRLKHQLFLQIGHLKLKTP